MVSVQSRVLAVMAVALVLAAAAAVSPAWASEAEFDFSVVDEVEQVDGPAPDDTTAPSEAETPDAPTVTDDEAADDEASAASTDPSTVGEEMPDTGGTATWLTAVAGAVLLAAGAWAARAG